MKESFRSFVSFTRAERMGLMVLLILLAILIAVRATMSLWVHPPAPTAEDKRLAAAWETYKRSQPAITDSANKKKDFEDNFSENETPLPDTIDLNTADSALLVRLKGIGPVTAGRIVGRRIKKGPYTDIEQLKEIGVFSQEVWELLKKHLVVGMKK